MHRETLQGSSKGLNFPDLNALQGEELEPVRGKAEQFGVKEIYIDDLREEFVRDYVFPMFRCASYSIPAA